MAFQDVVEWFDEVGFEEAVRLHGEIVTTAATASISVIEDLNLLDGELAETPAPLLMEILARYAESTETQEALYLLAGAVDELRDGFGSASESQAAALESFSSAIDEAENFEQLELSLAPYLDSGIEGLDTGAAYSLAIILDGVDTIYDAEESPLVDALLDHDPPTVDDEVDVAEDRALDVDSDEAPSEPDDGLSRARRNQIRVLRVGKDDAKAGGQGGVGGGLLGGVAGIVPGAVVGAGVGSAFSVIGRVIDAIRGDDP